MWRTKRQTKKHKLKNKPKVVAQLIFCFIGILAIFFVVLTVFSLTRTPSLIVPVSLSHVILGASSVHGGDVISLVEKSLKEENVSYLFVTIASGSGILVTMPGNAEVVMKNDDIASQIASLQLITDRLTMEGKRFRRLDLRYDRPVVVLAN